ncbi:hypothetical protein [Amycolatopsis coloradensis]|uniref:hypothetical protein n=1 Tax=Amycolatopsis coloradensis TaxID=76021 RepID=UPI001300D348|nr:hypothetical protein [Amycolatopsis coloradensis]
MANLITARILRRSHHSSKFVRMGQRPDRALGDVAAAAGGVPAGVTGDVLAEQSVD